MTKTHLVLKTTKQPASGDQKTVLDARAARFKLPPAGNGGAPNPATSQSGLDPAEAERRAARAARFADVQSAPVISTTGKVSIGASTTNITNSAIVDAEKLAKRAARFANIPK